MAVTLICKLQCLGTQGARQVAVRTMEIGLRNASAHRENGGKARSRRLTARYGVLRRLATGEALTDSRRRRSAWGWHALGKLAEGKRRADMAALSARPEDRRASYARLPCATSKPIPRPPAPKVGSGKFETCLRMQ